MRVSNIVLFLLWISAGEPRSGFNPTGSDYSGSVECVLAFYRTYTDSLENQPGTLISVHLVREKYNEFQNELLLRLADHRQSFFNSSLLVGSISPSGSQSRKIWSKIATYILIASSAGEVEQNVISWKKSSSWNPLARVFVILAGTQSSGNILFDGRMIFDCLLRFELLRSLVIHISFDQEVAEVLGSHPYDDHACADKVMIIESLERCYFDTQNRSTVSTLNVKYSNRTELWHKRWTWRNLMQCPLRISAAIYPPLASYIDKSSSAGVWSGAEVFVVRIVAKTLNMTAQIAPNYNDRNGGRRNGIRDIDEDLFNG